MYIGKIILIKRFILNFAYCYGLWRCPNSQVKSFWKFLFCLFVVFWQIVLTIKSAIKGLSFRRKKTQLQTKAINLTEKIDDLGK